MSFKIFRTSKTRVNNLQEFNPERPTSEKNDEPELKKDEVAEVESGVGDALEEIFGEAAQEVPPEEVNVPKLHVRKDDDPEDEPLEDETPKREYSGRVVEEGVNQSKASEVEAADLNDLISAAMGDAPDDNTTVQSKRSTSTPSKDDAGVDNADFGGFISMIRDDSEPPPPVENKKEEPRDVPLDKKSRDDSSRKSWSSGKPSSGSTISTSSYSFSSKFVPNIPASFYKDIQTKLEDLIFKFECLDNEYAALQKISHKVYVETMDIKKIFSNEY